MGEKNNYSLKGENANRIRDTLFICSVSLVLFSPWSLELRVLHSLNMQHNVIKTL